MPYRPLGGVGYRPPSTPTGLLFIFGCRGFRTPNGFRMNPVRTDPEWAPNGPRTDTERTPNGPCGPRTDPERRFSGAKISTSHYFRNAVNHRSCCKVLGSARSTVHGMRYLQKTTAMIRPSHHKMQVKTVAESDDQSSVY